MTGPRVFVSYSHDSEEHKQAVLALTNRLRQRGIDAWLDRYSPPPPEGWALWIERQIEAARWIIIVCTETYRRRVDQKEEPGKGRGVAYEAKLIRAALYDAAGKNSRVIPVVFRVEDTQHIPVVFVDSSRYVLPTDDERLFRHIAGTPEVEAPALGEQVRGAEPGAAKVTLPDIQSAGAPDEFPNSDASRGHPKPAKATRKRSRVKDTKRLLIVSANPDNRGPLQLAREIREINLMLRHSVPVPYDVHVISAAREEDLWREMLEVEPHILHFCCHGSRDGSIALERDNGQEAVLAADALAEWLKVAVAEQKRPLNLALLNFCNSHKMLNALADVAEVVVGPTENVADSHAVEFASAFYMGLASGCTAAFSYHLGCAAIEMSASVLRGPMRPYGIRCGSAAESALAGAVNRSHQAARTLAFFASEPILTSPIRLDREFRAIQSVLRDKPVRIEQRWATRVTDFLQTLLETRPEIVHLSGIGQEDGAFLFETTHVQDYCLAPSQAVAKALILFHADIRCALLLFSNSIKLAEQVEHVLDYVISINGSIMDETSRQFVEKFYQLIGYRRSYLSAYKGAVAILRGRSDIDGFSIRGRAVSR